MSLNKIRKILANHFVRISSWLFALGSAAWVGNEPCYESILVLFGAVSASIINEIQVSKLPREGPLVVSPMTGDKARFLAIREELSSNSPAIQLMSEHNMAGFAFRINDLNDLRRFVAKWQMPENEFLDEELDGKRRQMLFRARTYLDSIAFDTFPHETNALLQTVPPEWEHTDPQRFLEVVKRLHEQSEEFLKEHADFVRLGKRMFDL